VAYGSERSKVGFVFKVYFLYKMVSILFRVSNLADSKPFPTFLSFMSKIGPTGCSSFVGVTLVVLSEIVSVCWEVSTVVVVPDSDVWMSVEICSISATSFNLSETGVDGASTIVLAGLSVVAVVGAANMEANLLCVFSSFIASSASISA